MFQRSCIVEQISAQRMRKLAKNEIVFPAVVREMHEESRNEGIVIVNDDQTKTPYPVEVQTILEEFSDVCPKDLLVGCHRNVN